jgi:hypothetical protein
MINTFLKAKHWQLFVLVVGVPIALQIVFMGVIFSSVFNHREPDPAIFLGYMKWVPILMILLSSILFGWQWSVAIGLQSKVPANVKMKVGKFKVFFFIPIIYLILISISVGVFLNKIFNGYEPDMTVFLPVMMIVFPLHLLSIFGMIYTLYFVAKTFKTVELQREVEFSDFVGEFFLIWFYFIGVWFVQPKINKMVEGT